MLLILYLVTAKRLCQLFEFGKLGKQRRPGATGKVFSCIFLKCRGQGVRLVCLEIHRPFGRIRAGVFFNVIADLMLFGDPFKRANPSGHFNGTGAGVPGGQPLHAVAANFRGIAAMLHLLKRGGNGRFQHPPGQLCRLDRDRHGSLFNIFLHLHPPS